MKKKTLVWIAAFAATSLSQTASAAVSTAPAYATTLRALSVVKTDDLEFGTLIPGPTIGTATINPMSDARSTTGGVIGVAGAVPSAAHFTAAGIANAVALVALPGAIVLTRVSGTETMSVTGISSNGPTLRTFPSTAIVDVSVGGTLNIAVNQVAGDYTGTFVVNIIYF